MNTTVIFIRKEGFYPIELLSPKECGKSIKDQVNDHVKCNPGTLKVEDLNGNTIWNIDKKV